MQKVVFDTVVFVRALINPYSIWGTIIFEHTSYYRLFVSKEIIVELLEVIKRPNIIAKFKTFQDRDTKMVLEIISRAEVVETTSIFSASRDPKDDKFLATAKACGANYLVSENTDLLDLKEYKGIKIITAEAFLQILEQEKK